MPQAVKKADNKPKRQSHLITPEKTIEILAAYFYQGTFQGAGKICGVDKNTVKKYYDKATPEQIQTAKEKSNQVLEARLIEILELAYKKLLIALKNQKVNAYQLNIIVGTMTDKVMTLRGLNKMKYEHEHSGEINHNFKTYFELKEKAVNELNDSSNRIKKHFAD